MLGCHCDNDGWTVNLAPNPAHVFAVINYVRTARGISDPIDRLLLEGAEPYQPSKNPVAWAIEVPAVIGNVARFDSEREAEVFAGDCAFRIDHEEDGGLRIVLPACLRDVYLALGYGCINRRLFSSDRPGRGFEPGPDFRRRVVQHLRATRHPQVGGPIGLEEGIRRIGDALGGSGSNCSYEGRREPGLRTVIERELGRPLLEPDPDLFPEWLLIECNDAAEADRIGREFVGQTPIFVSGRLASLPRQLLGHIAAMPPYKMASNNRERTYPG